MNKTEYYSVLNTIQSNDARNGKLKVKRMLLNPKETPKEHFWTLREAQKGPSLMKPKKTYGTLRNPKEP